VDERLLLYYFLSKFTTLQISEKRYGTRTMSVRDAKWKDFKSALEKFVQREGHADVPQKHCEDGYRLGQGVRHVRSRGQFVKYRADRRAYLEDLGFKWSVSNSTSSRRRGNNGEDDRWLRFKMAIQQFKQREKHCLVPMKHVETLVVEGETVQYKLGQQVSEVRNTHQHIKRHEERKKWLTDLGFVWVVRYADKGNRAEEFFKMRAEEDRKVVAALRKRRKKAEEDRKIAATLQKRRKTEKNEKVLTPPPAPHPSTATTTALHYSN
jgi:hypothetical protein